MKHIIIDTNVIHLDYFLNKSRITALCSANKSLGYEVFIPDVVVDEMVKQYKEEMAGFAEQYNTALRQLKRRNSTISNPLLDCSVLTGDYENQLRDRIKQLGVHVIPYPKTDHKHVVARELSKKKPFKDSKKGYRDTLIWESIIKHCMAYKNDVTVFLSENSDDFASKDKLSFHPDLIADCNANAIELERLLLVTNVQKFIQEEIINKSTELNLLLDDLKYTDYLGNIDLKEVVKDYVSNDKLDAYINGDAYGESVVYIPGYYENPVIAGLEVSSIVFDSIHEISEEEIIVKCSVLVNLDLDVFIFHGDLPLIADNMLPYIYDYEWNDHYVAASDNATFDLQLNIVCDKKLETVISIDDQVVKVDYSTGYHFGD